MQTVILQTETQEQQYIAAARRAAAKLGRIIEREGDHNGERLADWYLEMLIWEELVQDAAILEYNGGQRHVYGGGRIATG